MYGEHQLNIWEQSFNALPPPMEKEHRYYNSIVNDSCYAQQIKPGEFPMHESPKLTAERTMVHWNNVIIPQLQEGKRIIIAAHGNSLRAIMKHLDQMTDCEIMKIIVPMGVPFVYELNENFKPVGRMKFIGDAATVHRALDFSGYNIHKGKKCVNFRE